MNTIEKTRLHVFSRDGWMCKVCGKFVLNDAPQLGHKIPQSRLYLRKYGSAVIHHPDNLETCCSLKCNSAVSINGKHKLVEELVESIRKKLDTDI